MAWVPLLDQCAKLLGKKATKGVCQKRWKRQEMHRLLDGTPFEGRCSSATASGMVCQLRNKRKRRIVWLRMDSEFA